MQRRNRRLAERTIFTQHPVHGLFTLEPHIGQQGECAAKPRKRFTVLKKICRDAGLTINLCREQVPVFEQSTELVL